MDFLITFVAVVSLIDEIRVVGLPTTYDSIMRQIPVFMKRRKPGHNQLAAGITPHRQSPR